jgi:hypothetical protein
MALVVGNPDAGAVSDESGSWASLIFKGLDGFRELPYNRGGIGELDQNPMCKHAQAGVVLIQELSLR